MSSWTSQIKDYTFLVTGSAGFIGYHLSRTLLAAGARVRVAVIEGLTLVVHED